MLLLTKIGMIDLIVICFITLALILIMIGIIILSSKKNNKKTSPKEVKIEIKETPKEDNIKNLVKEEKIKEENKTDIAKVLEKMEEELEHGPSKKAPSFEEEQEKKAIISYRELLKVAGKLKEEIKENEEYGEPKITEKVNFNEIEVEKNEDILDKNKNKKFQSSEFISPIYGKQEETKTNNENEDFLSSLKDFRKKLQ